MEEQIETLIEAVENRPAIYSKTLKEYSNINIKKQLWEEVCALVVENWGSLGGQDKIKAGLDVQKKWKSLRNHFARELRLQKSTKSGQSPSKRRKYIYFDKLLFLLPNIENDETSSNLDEPAEASEMNDQTLTDGVVAQERVSRKRRSAPPSKTSFEDSLLELVSKRNSMEQTSRSEESGEDVHFALSLVPLLKSLSDYKKMEAKIEIMKALKSVKWPQNPSNTPEMSHFPGLSQRFNSAGPSFSQNTPDPPFLTSSHMPYFHQPIPTPILKSLPPIRRVTSPLEASVHSFVSNFTDESDNSDS